MLRRALGLTALALAAPLSALSAQETPSGDRPVLEVTGTEYEFRMPATEVPSGWTTLELENRGEETHELVMVRVPEEGTYRELRRFLGVQDTLLTRLESGAIDSAEYLEAVKRHRPAWVSDIEAVGVLPLAPGRSMRATVDLAPGVYQAICFVGDSTGRAHWRRGMQTRLEVTGESTDAAPPAADVEMTVAGGEIETEGRLRRGSQTVAVRFGERPSSAEGPPPSLRLVRLEEGATVEEARAWDASAPAPVEFLGGTPGRPAGETVYLTVDLEPGRFAWLGPSELGMTETFTVP